MLSSRELIAPLASIVSTEAVTVLMAYIWVQRRYQCYTKPFEPREAKIIH